MSDKLPQNPYVEQVATLGNKSWYWDGLVWRRYYVFAPGEDPTDPADPSDPEDIELTYMNPEPVPVTVGGIEAGWSFEEKVPLQDMWTMLLYPFQQPRFTQFYIEGQSQSLGFGDYISAHVLFKWNIANPQNVKPNSIKIISGGDVIHDNLPNNGEFSTILPEDIQMPYWGAAYTFRIEALTVNDVPFGKNFTVKWNDEPSLPRFTYFRLDGHSNLVLEEYESTPAEPLFTWAVDDNTHINFNEGFTIKHLPSKIIKSNLEVYQYQSDLDPISGSSAADEIIRISGKDEIGRTFKRDITISWEAFDKPVIEILETDAPRLEEGDALASPTIFSWNILNIHNVEPHTFEIIKKGETDQVWYAAQTDSHHESSSSSQEISHDPIVHNEPYTEVFQLRVIDKKGDVVTKLVSIEWKELNLVTNLVTLNAVPSDAGQVSGGGHYEQNSEVNIQASSEELSQFDKWEVISGGAEINDVDSTHTYFIMPANAVEIHALFIPPITVTTNVFPQNKGRIKAAWQALGGGSFYNNGQAPALYQILFTPEILDSLFLLDKVDVYYDGVYHSEIDLSEYQENTSWGSPSENNQDIHYDLFMISPGVVTLSESAIGVGILEGGGLFKEDNIVNISVSDLDPLYEFIEWQVISGEVTLDNPNSQETFFTMPGTDVEVKAIYKDPYTLTVQRSHSQGTITINGSTGTNNQVKGGQTANVAISNLGSYSFDDWEEVSGLSGQIHGLTTTTISFIMPENNVTIKANLSPPPPQYLYCGAEASNQFTQGPPAFEPVEDYSFIDLDNEEKYTAFEGSENTNHPSETIPNDYFTVDCSPGPSYVIVAFPKNWFSGTVAVQAPGSNFTVDLVEVEERDHNGLTYRILRTGSNFSTEEYIAKLV